MSHKVNSILKNSKGAISFLQKHLHVERIVNRHGRVEISYYLDTDDSEECTVEVVKSSVYEAWLKQESRMTMSIEDTDSQGDARYATYNLSSYTEYLYSVEYDVRYEDAKEYLMLQGIVKVPATITVLKEIAKTA